MGIDARWETENGEALAVVDDPSNHLAWFAMKRSAPYPLLRFLDAYGDTTFNQLQLPILVGELAQATAEDGLPPAVAAHLAAIHALALKALGETHTYVKFVGD